MHELDHWHPVLRSRDLRKKPLGITLADKDLVLFRGHQGKAAAFLDVCPHRGMRLSKGWVEDGNLTCPYHGWAFDVDGQPVVPPALNRKACPIAFDVVERYDMVWVKRTGVAASFPRIPVEGFHKVACFQTVVEAPLELVLDNFIEVEHTATTHAFLGYTRQSIYDEVEVAVQEDEDSLKVSNRGPQKRIPAVIEKLVGIRSGDTFHDEWTTWFSPVWTLYDHFWKCSTTGEFRGEKLRTAVFFNPISTTKTQLWVLSFSLRSPALRPLSHLLTRASLRLEVWLDKRMVESLADKSPQLKGKKLGRYDAALGKARAKIDQIYRKGKSRVPDAA